MTEINWSVDSCWCIYQVDENFNFISVVQKCLIHNHLGDVGAFNSAKARMTNFNRMPKLPNETALEHVNRIATDKLEGKKPTKP